jgi:tetratricopeptide (TPR) repeat protein
LPLRINQKKKKEGKLEEAQQKTREAIALYKKALSIDPSHKESLVSLAVLSFAQEKYLVAEKYLTTVVRNDPTHHVAWFYLGKVLNAKGESTKAGECFATALELEETVPVIPISKIKRSL